MLTCPTSTLCAGAELAPLVLRCSIRLCGQAGFNPPTLRLLFAAKPDMEECAPLQEMCGEADVAKLWPELCAGSECPLPFLPTWVLITLYCICGKLWPELCAGSEWRPALLASLLTELLCSHGIWSVLCACSERAHGRIFGASASASNASTCRSAHNPPSAPPELVVPPFKPVFRSINITDPCYVDPTADACKTFARAHMGGYLALEWLLAAVLCVVLQLCVALGWWQLQVDLCV